MKKIVFDARMYGLEHAGIGRYVMNLLKNLEIRPPSAMPRRGRGNPKFEIILLVKREKVESVKAELGDRFKYIPVRSRHYSFFEQIEIPFILTKVKPDLVHFPHFNAPILWRNDFVVTIHDLIKHYFTGKETTTRTKWLYLFKHWAYKLQINHALNRSKLIFVPSQFWKDKLADDFCVESEKIMVTPEATDDVYFKPRSKAKQNYDMKPPYLIYTGSVYSHKNIKIVFEALQDLPEIELGIACSRNVFTDRVQKTAIKMGLGNQFKFLGFVPDEDLQEIYQGAVALVQPSLMEGFGLTGLEAMSAGVPVIAADASCLPEVYGEGAVYFDPYDKDNLVERIKDLINDENLRQRVIDQGRKRVKDFSWKKTAKLTFQGYKKALK